MYWMTKHIRRLFATAVAFSVLLLSPTPTMAQKDSTELKSEAAQWLHVLPQNVAGAIGRGDVAGLSPSLGQSVELRMPNGSGVYSKKQAEMILADFFAAHRSKSYRIDREGSEGSATQTIGTLQTEKGTFRISLLSQQFKGSFQIKQFRIEEQK